MQILLRLPDDLANGLKSSVPKTARSAFAAGLLAKALPEQDDALFQLAMDVENDPERVGMASDWDAVAGDGIATR